MHNSLSSTIRELSLNASGYYIGATTHISLGRLLGSAMSNPAHSESGGETEAHESPARPSKSMEPATAVWLPFVDTNK